MSDTNSSFCGNKYKFIQMAKAIRVRKDLDMESKVLYSYLFTTAQLSFSNKLSDENGVYVYVDFKKLFNWKKELIKSRLDALEKVNLIKVEHSKVLYQKSKVYVYDFDKTPITEYFTSESIQRFSFLQIPFSFAFEERFAGITTDAMILYAFYIDLKTLSSKNENYWDSENRVFIDFSCKDAEKELGWSRTKFWRVNESLKELDLIEIKRSGNGKTNRIYPKDYLYAQKPINIDITGTQMLPEKKADVSKTDPIDEVKDLMFQNIEADVSKTDPIDGLKDLMFQNIEADVSKTDVSKADVSKTDTNNTHSFSSLSKLTSNTNKSINQIIENLVDDNFTYETKMKKIDRLKLENQLQLLILDNHETLEEETLLNFIDYQMSFHDRIESLQTAYEVCTSQNEMGSAHLHSTTMEFFEKMKAVLFAVYSNSEEINTLIKNIRLNRVNVLKNLLKLKTDNFEKLADRLVKNMYDLAMQGEEIHNLPAYLIKSLNNEGTLILQVRI